MLRQAPLRCTSFRLLPTIFLTLIYLSSIGNKLFQFLSYLGCVSFCLGWFGEGGLAEGGYIGSLGPGFI